MEIGAGGELRGIGGEGGTGVLIEVPLTSIDGFAETEIKGDVRVSLPFEAEVSATT